jgi:histidinol-phosphatase (PHP family)
VLGSVHWLGSFLVDDEESLPEWNRRDVAGVWDEYTRFIEDLADARLVDVLAHPDVVKVFGFRPPDETPVRERIVAAAKRNGLALEVNTNGLRKPVGELYPHPEILRAARAAGVPVTLASDAHAPERVGLRFGEGIAAARAAGYDGYLVFERRMGRGVAF